MKLNNIFAALFTAFFLISSFADASEEVAIVGAESGKWTMDYDAAIKLAGEKNLPLILNFTGSDWCGWCKLMDQNVFAADTWQKYAAEKVVLVTIDFPQDKLKVPADYLARNNVLKDQFQIRGFPTYVVLDSDGKSVLGQLGAGQEKTPEIFIEEFESVARFSAANIAAYSAAHPDKADAFKDAFSEFKKVEDDFKAWIETGPQKNDENTKKFEGFQAQMDAAMVKLDQFK